MSGHNTAFELGQPQAGTSLDGRMLLIKEGNPGASDTGFATGAICIRSDATGQVGTSTTAFWVNIGDAVSPNWKSVFLNS